MTDLHTLANAISDSSPNIKAFAQAVADVLEPAAPPPPPPPPPTGAAPVWNGVIPSGQWEYAREYPKMQDALAFANAMTL